MATLENLPELTPIPNVTAEWLAANPDVDVPVFESETVRFYFLLFEILKFIRTNPLYTYDTVNGTYSPNTANINDLTLLNVAREVDVEDATLVLAEANIVDDFFTTVIDQPVFNSQDHLRFRQYLMDWYTSQRALVTRSKKSVDPYQLPSKDLDDLFLGFGFDYSYVLDRNEKASLLYQLIRYYQSKGTPNVFSSILTFFGVINVTLSEWWLEVVKVGSSQQLYMRNRPIWTPFDKSDPDIYSQFSYLPFVQHDPHWYYDKDLSEERVWDLYNEIDNNPESENYGGYKNQITLPSITPYLTIDNKVRHSLMIPELAVFNRKGQDSFEYWCEYVLLWGGDATATPDVTASVTNTVLRIDGTDRVFNGTEWIDLNCLLPDELVMSEPTCASAFTQPRNITLNLSRLVPTTQYNQVTGLSEYVYEEFSFFETMLGAYYLLGLEYIPNLKRMTATDDSSLLPNLTVYEGTGQFLDIDPAGNYLIECTDTDTDWIWWKSEWRNLLTKLTDYQDTNGYFSYCVFIPKQLTDPEVNKYLYYTGEFAPFDSTHTYVDSTTGLTISIPNCRDGIDDIDYADVRNEYLDITARPTNIPISDTIMFGTDGTEHPESYWRYDDIVYSDDDGHYYLDAGKVDYHSARQERQRRLAILNQRFYSSFPGAYDNDTTDGIYRGWVYNPMPYLKATSPSLATALEYIAYDCGIANLRGEQKLKREKEKYFLSLSLYLKEIGLKNLIYLSNFLLGYALSDIIKQIIIFFKPFRARFKSFMTEYIIDDSLSDGSYVADHPYISKVNQIVPEDVNPQDAIHIRRTFPIVDYALSPYFDESYFFDVFFSKIKMTIDEHIYVTDDAIRTTHLLEHDDVSPYEQFGTMRAMDNDGAAISTVTIEEGGAIEVWENGTYITDLSKTVDGYGEDLLAYQDSTAIGTLFKSEGFYTVVGGGAADASLTQWTIDPLMKTLELEGPTLGANVLIDPTFADWREGTNYPYLYEWTALPEECLSQRTLNGVSIGANLTNPDGSQDVYVVQDFTAVAGDYLITLDFITSNLSEIFIAVRRSTDEWWTGSGWDSIQTFVAVESVRGQRTVKTMVMNVVTPSEYHFLEIHGGGVDNSVIGVFNCQVAPITAATVDRDLVYYIGAHGTNESMDYNFRYWDTTVEPLDSTSWEVDVTKTMGADYNLYADMVDSQYGPYCVKNELVSGTVSLYVSQTKSLAATTPYEASFYAKTINANTAKKHRIAVQNLTTSSWWRNASQDWGAGGTTTNAMMDATNSTYEKISMPFNTVGANNYDFTFVVDSVDEACIDRCFIRKYGIDAGEWAVIIPEFNISGSIDIQFLSYTGATLDSITITDKQVGPLVFNMTVASDPIFKIRFRPGGPTSGGTISGVEFRRIFTNEI